MTCSQSEIRQFGNPGGISETVMVESPDLWPDNVNLLMGTLIGENLDHACWASQPFVSILINEHLWK